MQILHKMNYTPSFSDIVQQNKIWANLAVSRKAVKKEFKDTKNSLRQL